jgi:GxxExxY protein
MTEDAHKEETEARHDNISAKMEISADELTRNVIGAGIEIHTAMGPGHPESSYRRALVRVLRQDGLLVDEEKSFDVEVRGCVVASAKVDLWIEQELVVELKAVGRLTDAHLAQLGRYVDAAEVRRGLLINFGEARLRTQRFTNFDAPIPKDILRAIQG